MILTLIMIDLDSTTIAAIITFVGAIFAAIITGVFNIIGKKPKKGSDNHVRLEEDATQKIEKKEYNDLEEDATQKIEKKEYDADEYMHNAFIPSLDALEKEESDNDFAEKLTVFLGVDRKEEDISLIRKEKE